jgi:uncharacterized protein YndB with AHSA1/START domain
MLAKLERVESGYLAVFERHFNHSIEMVWSVLTENDMLAKWFSELRVDELREGGIIKFDMQDGTYEEMIITEMNLQSVLEYTWGDDRVRFELFEESNGCQLLLKEKISTLTDHTPRDLAGWHVCLEVINAVLDGRLYDTRNSEWEKWYERYKQVVEEVTKN